MINILGLATGLACCLLILLYVWDELSYDSWNPKADHVYRINLDANVGGKAQQMAAAGFPMGPTLKKDYPQVESYVRFRNSGPLLIKVAGDFVEEKKAVYADSTLFNVFPFVLTDGETKGALSARNSVVITEKAALRYLGTRHAAGRTLLIGDKAAKVTAVIRNIPSNTHFDFDIFLPIANIAADYEGNWGNHGFNTYLLLRRDTDPRSFEKNFDQVVRKYFDPWARKSIGYGFDDLQRSGQYLRYSLMPVRDIHLHSNMSNDLAANGNIQYVYIFCAVALFILMIACVNFMNLSTARSAHRAKEVGIRKTLGSSRESLTGQFLTESIFISLLALIIAIGLSSVLLPLFNTMSGKSLQLHHLFVFPFVILLALIPFAVGLLAGVYPAFFLSAYKPLQVLKGKMQGRMSTATLRSSLVVFQFVTSVILIIATLVIYRQLQYIQQKQLGFNREQVLVVSNTSYVLGDKTHSFEKEVLSVPGVVSGTVSSYLPVSSTWRSDNQYYPGTQIDQAKATTMQEWNVDEGYLQTLGMELTSGRNFSREFGTDSGAIILNETVVRKLGFKDPVGKKVCYVDVPRSNKVLSYTVIGVVKDFNYESLHEQVSPLGLTLAKPGWNEYISFRLNTGNIQDAIAGVRAKWKSFVPDQPFNYQFLDQEFDNMYRAEQRMGGIALSFAVLAIFIACLGLFGLAAFTAEQRTKEIGIRKVLGASVSGIVQLLSGEFLKLVLIAVVIASPIAWYAMDRWLQDFAYRAYIPWWVFALAGLAAVVIALLTVSFQSVKAALTNPVKALRSE